MCYAGFRGGRPIESQTRASSPGGGCAGRSARFAARSPRTSTRRLLRRELGSADSSERLDCRSRCPPGNARALAAARARAVGGLVSARSPGTRVSRLGGRRPRLGSAGDPAPCALCSDAGSDAHALSARNAARRNRLGVAGGGLHTRARNAPLPQRTRCRRVGRQPLVPAARLLEQPRPLGCDGPGARARPRRPFTLAGAASGSRGRLRALRGNPVLHVLARGLDSARRRPAGGVRRRSPATRTRRLGRPGLAVAGRRHSAGFAFAWAHDRHACAGAGTSRRQIPRSCPRRPVHRRGSHRVGTGAGGAAASPDARMPAVPSPPCCSQSVRSPELGSS